MKILILGGSPRKNGNSNELIAEFARGARESGHTTDIFDAGKTPVHPCIACDSCRMNGPCIYKDAFEEVREKIVLADLVVFSTPLYYYGISAQLKAVIDRFYAINEQIHIPKKAMLFLTYADNAKASARAVEAYYDALLAYLGWKDAGRLIVPGVWTAGSVKRTPFPEKAYTLGKSL